MGQTSKTLLTALIISLFSLTAIQAIKIITMSNSSQVLGETSLAPPIAQGVPCDTINNWQKRYCSTEVAPTRTPFPTSVVIPTPPSPTSVTGCKSASATFLTGSPCKSSTEKMLSYAKYQCQDKITVVQVGDLKELNCYTQDTLHLQALSRCSEICIHVVPTGKSLPTSTPAVRN